MLGRTLEAEASTGLRTDRKSAISNGLPAVLEGFTLFGGGDLPLPASICAQHLALLGADRSPSRLAAKGYGTRRTGGGDDPQAPGCSISLLDDPLKPRHGIECDIHWIGSEADAAGNEVLVQAISGLMAVHGKDRGMPRRLGLEAASVAAGIIATQGLLAGLIGCQRGRPARRGELSVLQAALLFLNHHIAIATCEPGFRFPEPGPAPGPPFSTEDGHWVELEMLSYGSWLAFWKRLGVEQEEMMDSWLSYVYRYTAGRCGLPESLHQATRRHTLESLRAIADACQVGSCRLRSYQEVLAELPQAADLARPPWTIRPGAAYRPHPRPHAGGGPLAGFKVVESTSRLQGPLASHLLRSLGAEVIKIEAPGGDFTRSSPPLAGQWGAAYLAYNRGKQVIEVDYKLPSGRRQIQDLVAGADVFLHNWRLGRAEELGFDDQSLARINPGLVYASASGWAGSDGPCSIAGDYLVQAHAGCGEGLNPVDEPAFPSRVTLIDVLGGLLACEGILAGLYWRGKRGRGCRVDTSLLAAAGQLQKAVLEEAHSGREKGRRRGRPVWGPLDRPIPTSDGFLAVTIADAASHARLVEICGLRNSPPDALIDSWLLAQFRCRPSSEWQALLKAGGIAAAAITEQIDALPLDPRAAGLLEPIHGACQAPASPWRFVE